MDLNACTAAALALPEKMRKRGWTQSRLAKKLGVSQAAVSAWITRKARPTYLIRRRIAVLLGIPETDWETAEERAILAETLRTGTEG